MIYFILSYILSFLFYFILRLITTKYHVSQTEREEGLEAHKLKNGTPTLGGLIFVIVPCILMLIKKRTFETLLICLSFLLFSLIGFIDDIKIIKFKQNDGLTPKMRLIVEYLIATFLLILLLIKGYSSKIMIMSIAINTGFLYIPIMSTFIVGTANSYNLTDGIDSLLASLSIIIAIGLLIFSFNKECYTVAFFLICFIISISAFYFLNYNRAVIFMGDTGSLAIGGGLSVIAIILDIPFYFMIMSIPLYFETITDILQITYFKITKGKRLFLMAPFHHHLEILGYSEKLITALFSLIEIIFVIFCLFLAKIF